jgi:DNA-3-methyladenine glycosylase I
MGVPLHYDRRLFEMLCLEGAQAGLSWLTILKRRDNYRRAFDNFEAAKIAVYDDAKMAQLLQHGGIIRNRLKVKAFVQNAKAFYVPSRSLEVLIAISGSLLMWVKTTMV